MTKPEFRPFYTAHNLVDSLLGESCPWDFKPSADALAAARAILKKQRTKWAADARTQWQIYSAVGGVIRTRRLGKDNQAAVVHGLVADYDVKTNVAEVRAWVSQMPPEFQPQFIEVSLSRKIRLVWIFERPFPVRDTKHAEALILGLIEKIKVRTLLPGYDSASEKPEQVWTNGGEWHQWREQPMAWQLVFGLAVDAFKNMSPGSSEIPLDKIAAEVSNRWGGRWQGEFKLNALGVRFWDPTADCTTGCQVKPDGMVCFTGHVGFMSWKALFGGRWVDEQRAINLAESAGETFFDGNAYYQQNGSSWYEFKREDILLDLRARNVSASKGRGETISDAERVLHHIQRINRVHGCAPLICRKPGVVDMGGRRILNTATLRLIEPVSRPCTYQDFNFLWTWFEGMFARPQLELEPLLHFLAWLKRAYISIRERCPAMGQAVFFCGPVSNGKTLLCMHVIRPLLGGRAENPYKYFVGKTDFTDELFGAGLWAINDEETPANEQERMAFLAKTKAAVVNPEQTYHPKFCKKLSLPWQGRMVVTSNDDAQSIGMLPEANESTRDKLMFFATKAYAGVWPEQTVLERTIADELPYFARWLLDWQPPENVKDSGRMGVKSYFDPWLLEKSNQQSFSYHFKELLMQWAAISYDFADEKPTWRGNPTELRVAMFGVEALRPMLLDWSVPKVTKALTGLARIGNNGVSFVEGTKERTFLIDRAGLNPTK